MTKKIAIVNTHSPFNTPIAKESLDLALIFGAFDQQVCVIFVENGVYQLLNGQDPETIQNKDFLATMKALALYDIEQIVCCSTSAKTRGIEPTQITDDAKLLSSHDIATLLQSVDHVVMQ